MLKDNIQAWINIRFGVPNTFNSQLLYDFYDWVVMVEKKDLMEFVDWFNKQGFVVAQPDILPPIVGVGGDGKLYTGKYHKCGGE